MDLETVKIMKRKLFEKLKAEGCYFTYDDIVIDNVTPNQCRIVIGDYVHLPFNLELIFDEIMGYEVWITCDGETVCYESSMKAYPVNYAMIELGYYIGSHF